VYNLNPHGGWCWHLSLTGGFPIVVNSTANMLGTFTMINKAKTNYWIGIQIMTKSHQLLLVRSNLYECTIDQELMSHALSWLTDAAASSRQMWNDVMAAILKVWRHYQKSDSVNQCVFTWRTIVPNFIPIQFETTEIRLFWRQSPQQQEQDK